LSFTHFYGRAAAELSFSDLVLRTFTGLMKTDISYNSLNLYLYGDKTYSCNRKKKSTRHACCNGSQLSNICAKTENHRAADAIQIKKPPRWRTAQQASPPARRQC
jgi:hypothetical protein